MWSVIVPTQNRVDSIRDCLRALAGLSYPHDLFEVIVVDDGGDDGWRLETELVSPDLGARMQVRLVRQAPSGPAAARNHGASVARGEYLAFSDDDCAPTAEWLSELECALRSNPHALVGGRVVNGLDQNPYSTASQLLIDYLCAEYTYKGQPRFLTSNNLALSREAFVRLGGFDETFPLPAAEDRELAEHWRQCGGEIVYRPDAVVRHLHRLTLSGFLRQHFHYGRGAHRFRRICNKNGWARIPTDPLRFYFGLLVFPLKRGSQRSISPFLLIILFVVSQLAGVAGYLRESFAIK